MKKHLSSLVPFSLILFSTLISLAAFGQNTQTTQTEVQPGVPHLVKFGGVLKDASGQLLSGTQNISFAIYAQSTGGTALWAETQNVQFSEGNYNIMLGANTSEGLPPQIFVSGQPQWLGVRILSPGEEEQPRVLLTSVPYALKAVDADTLGGLPASAFVQARGPNGSLTTQSTTNNLFSSKHTPLGGTGTANYIPIWTDSSGDLGNSAIYQSGTGTSAMIGIGTTTPTSTLNVVQSGVFTGATYQSYTSSLIGGLSPGVFAHAGCYGCTYPTDAIAGAVLIPSGALTDNAEGIAGYCQTNADSTYNGAPGFHGNCVGGFFKSQANATNSAAWGLNPIVVDTPGTTNTLIDGLEIDMAAYGSPSRYNGILLFQSANTSIDTATINTAGTGYKLNDVLGVEQTNASGGTLTVTSIGTGGAITGLSVASAGTGYLNANGLSVSGGSGTGATVNITNFTPQMPPSAAGMQFFNQGSIPVPNGIILGQNFAVSFAQSYPACAHTGTETCSAMPFLFRGVHNGVQIQSGLTGDNLGNLVLDPAPNRGVTVNGNLSVSGAITAGTKDFKIDHPLDPANKYLYHTSVESPDMMNVYNGNIILDANGEAEIQLPDYFEALNQDFRYQLTCIGGFAPVYVAREIQNNSFHISGGTSGLKVSWQVTGIRHDVYADAHRSPVEVEKPAEERGHYLHPELFGAAQDKAIGAR